MEEGGSSGACRGEINDPVTMLAWANRYRRHAEGDGDALARRSGSMQRWLGEARGDAIGAANSG